jgi:acetoacetate decarboxylase
LLIKHAFPAQCVFACGEELEVLGPLKVGRGYRFSFSHSVTDIEILADLTA